MLIYSNTTDKRSKQKKVIAMNDNFHNIKIFITLKYFTYIPKSKKSNKYMKKKWFLKTLLVSKL